MKTAHLAATLFALSAAACLPEQETLEPWDDPGEKDQFLGFDVMPHVELIVEPEHVDALRANPREWVPGTIVIDGESFGPVGVKLKGQNSFQPIDEKPAFRINVDEYIEGVTLYGLQDMTFNNMVSDASLMHERLAYLVMREAGLPASRSNHMTVTFNGELYGLYANVETVKPRMIKEYFDDNNGTLFDATDVDFAPQYVGAYEISNGPDDRTLLEGLARALTIADPDQALAAASEFIDLEHFQRYWAAASVVGHFDGFPYSLPGDDYKLYADPTTRKLWFIPWGMDETFFAADFSPMQVNSVLARRCLESTSCTQGYVDLVWEIQAMTEELGLEQIRAEVQEQIAPYVDDDGRKPYSAAEVAEGQRQMGYFIRGRRETLGWHLPPAN